MVEVTKEKQILDKKCTQASHNTVFEINIRDEMFV